MSHTRDANLPDYLRPPINEVVLGVQFLTPPGYGQIYSGGVWDLYRAQYPLFEVHPPLSPSFEIFGRPTHSQFYQSTFRIGAADNHDRFWFLTPDKSELLQFQQDRLMHNWRELPELRNQYPRFDNMIANFHDELVRLNNFMTTIPSGQPLQINQCEVSYINHLPISTDRKADFWINLLNLRNIDPENLTFGIQEVLSDSSGNPFARLIIEAYSGINFQTGAQIVSLNLTVRGAPTNQSIDAAVAFLNNARNIIVNKFTSITTQAAHETWERQQ